MKRALILVSFLAFHSAQAFRQHAPPHPPLRHDSFSSSSESDSSMSSEEDSFERIVDQKKQVQPEKFVQLQKQQQQRGEKIQPQEEKKNKFFDRPSSEELEAYDEKVQRQNRNRGKWVDFVQEDPVVIEGPMSPAGPPKKDKMDETDEKLFLAALGQIYLDKIDEEQRQADRFPGPIGPMGPPGPPMDIDYFFVPYEEEGKKQANNNGNNNVHVNVNHVQVNSNVLHVPPKEEKKGSDHHHDHERPPIVPAYHMSEPINETKYLYFNLNATDACIMAVLVVAFLFATKKAYSRCFPKKEAAPQLPTTLPPTYTPSHVVVETTSKKMAPQ